MTSETIWQHTGEPSEEVIEFHDPTIDPSDPMVDR